jgi:hypothetical protein
MANSTLAARKLAELKAVHRDLFRKLFGAGRIPVKELDNFYGRATPRQTAILMAMKGGNSYSAAYKLSSDVFDTKRPEKVVARTAAARGHLLTCAAQVCQMDRPEILTKSERRNLHSLVQALSAEASELARQILMCDLRESEELASRLKFRVAVANRKFIPMKSSDTVRQLETACSKLRKTTRDLPHLIEHLGVALSVRDAAKAFVEIGRIFAGVQLFLTAIDGKRFCVAEGSGEDAWGIGLEYAASLSRLRQIDKRRHRIATHSKPDADALVAAWIAERFLFRSHQCQVEFVDYSFRPSSKPDFDCVVDVGKTFNPARNIFDHKPPAFEDRHQSCAAKLIWEKVRKRHRLSHLAELVELIHDGDAITRRSRSARYAHSNRTGLHAVIRHARNYSQSDQMLYQAIKAYLDAWRL